MNKIFLISALLSILSIYSCKENNKPTSLSENEVAFFINKADSFYKIGDLKSAINIYRKIHENGYYKNNDYKLAKAYALAYNKDSAYYYLEIAASQDSGFYQLYSGEFINMINDDRWDKILDLKLNNYQAKFGEFNKPDLAKRLFNMRIKDQAYYYYFNIYPDSISHYWDIKIPLNNENLVEFENIVEEYGWPKRSDVGSEIAPTAFLIVQHTLELENMKKYYSYLKEAVEQNEAGKNELALLTDRINISEGKKQVYGSQISYDSIKKVYFVGNVIDPENLNKRRAEVGMQPIEDYLKNWNAELRL